MPFHLMQREGNVRSTLRYHRHHNKPTSDKVTGYRLNEPGGIQVTMSDIESDMEPEKDHITTANRDEFDTLVDQESTGYSSTLSSHSTFSNDSHNMNTLNEFDDEPVTLSNDDFDVGKHQGPSEEPLVISSNGFDMGKHQEPDGDLTMPSSVMDTMAHKEPNSNEDFNIGAYKELGDSPIVVSVDEGDDKIDKKSSFGHITISDPEGEIILYSSFWDDRPSVEGPAAVRVLAVIQLNLHNKQPGTIACNISCETEGSTRFSVVNATQVYPTKSPTYPIIDRWKDRTACYCSYVVTCHPGVCGPNDRNHHVTLLRVIDGWATSITRQKDDFLPIEFPEKAESPLNFVLCHLPIFGHRFDQARIVEWLEMQRILGVNKIVVYNESMDHSTAEVLLLYRMQGLVEIRQSPTLKNNGNYSVPDSHLRQGMIFSDCMYRNMYKYHYVISSDMDEVIVPTNASTLLDMIDLAKRASVASVEETTTKVASYVFPESYWPSEHYFGARVDKSQPEHLYFLRHRYRNTRHANVSELLAHPKHITDPKCCIAMKQHYCRLLVENVRRFRVPSDIGKVHHYRSHPSGGHERFWTNTTVRDDRMLAFAAALKRNVEKQISFLNDT